MTASSTIGDCILLDACAFEVTFMRASALKFWPALLRLASMLVATAFIVLLIISFGCATGTIGASFCGTFVGVFGIISVHLISTGCTLFNFFCISVSPSLLSSSITWDILLPLLASMRSNN